MPLPPLREPDLPKGSLQLPDYDHIYRRLYRRLVFKQPDRVVHPGSWLEHIPFAFWLVDAVRPSTLVELGTHSGNSYAAFAQAIAMLELPAAAYAVDTWRGDAQAGFYDESVFVEWEAYHARHFSSFSQLIRSTFDEAAQHFADDTVDLLHIDGCHTYEAVSADFAAWRPKLSPRGVVLFHDTNVRTGDFGSWRLWSELKESFPWFEFLHGHGLGVLAVGADPPDAIRWLIDPEVRAGDTAVVVREFFAALGAAVGGRLESRATAHAIAAATQAAVTARDAELHERGLVASRLASELATAQQDFAASQRAFAVAQTLLRQREQSVQRLQAELDQRRAALFALEAAQSRQQETIRAQARVIAELHQLRHRQGHAPSQPPRDRPATPVEQIRQRGEGAVRLGLRSVRRAASTPTALGLVPTRRRGWRRPALRLLLSPARLREADLIVRSGLFDESYYAGRNRDVRVAAVTPLAHFVLQGGMEGRHPHPLFDAAYYLRRHPDVAAMGVNPLLHYLRSGAFEGRSPHPLFDVTFYLRSNPDLGAQRVEPLGHFLRFGVQEGRNPNELFDCAYYLRHNPDVVASGINPLVHFAVDGWRERRRPSPHFDLEYYLSQYPDVAQSGENPVAHYLEIGRLEGRRALPDQTPRPAPAAVPVELAVVPLTVRSVAAAAADEPPTVVCVSHVMPCPPRAGNEYRIVRMLRWFRDQGYRVVPVVAPLPGERIDADAARRLAAEFSNAVVCHRDGRVDYVLGSVPDVLKSLTGEVTRPSALLLGEPPVGEDHAGDQLRLDRLFCHDVLIEAVLRLQQALGPHVLLAEYIWMTRLLPLVPSTVVKVVDTHDVFSTKRDKVLRFGVDDQHVEAVEEAIRLRRADLVIAIQDDERRELQRLVPERPVVTAGVDFDVVEDDGRPTGRRILYVASANPMNRKGLADFLRFAWPRVRRDLPDAELMLAGDIGDSLTVEVPGVTRLGRVADLSQLYRDARLVINPAVAGTGLRIKTLEALGHFRPVLTWPTGVDGIATELAARCIVVQDWYAFARELSVRLGAEAPPSFSDAERATIRRLLTPEVAYRELTDAVAALLRERSATAAATPPRRSLAQGG